MSRADYDDPLYRELIPVRLPTPPKADDGPTARWLAAHPDEAAERHLKAVGE